MVEAALGHTSPHHQDGWKMSFRAEGSWVQFRLLGSCRDAGRLPFLHAAGTILKQVITKTLDLVQKMYSQSDILESVVNN